MREIDYPALTPGELAAVGEALFGTGWRAELARAMAVAEVEIRKVETGRAAAPAAWRAHLVALAQDHALRALAAASSLLWCESRARSHAEDDEIDAPRPLFT